MEKSQENKEKLSFTMSKSEVIKMTRLNDKYNAIIKEFEEINDNFNYLINKNGEYVAYITTYGSDFDLDENHTHHYILRCKSKNKFIKILKYLDGEYKMFFKDKNENEE